MSEDEGCDCDCPSCDKTERQTLRKGTNENGSRRRNNSPKTLKSQNQSEEEDQSCECDCPGCDKNEAQSRRQGTMNNRRQRRNSSPKILKSQNQSEDEDQSCECDCPGCGKNEAQSRRQGSRDRNKRQRTSGYFKTLKSPNLTDDEDQSCGCPDCKRSETQSRRQGPMNNRRLRNKSKNQTGNDDQSCQCDCPQTLQGTGHRQRRNGSPKFKTSQDNTDQSCECDCPGCNHRQEEKAMHWCNNCSCPECVRLRQSGLKRPGKSRNFKTNRKSNSKFQGDDESMEDSCECESSDEEASRKRSRNQSRKSSNRKSSAQEYSDDMGSAEDSCDCECPGCINNSKEHEESQKNPNCVCNCPVCLRRTNQMGTVRKSYSADYPRSSKTSNYPRNSSSGVGGNYANQNCCNCSCGRCCSWNRNQNQNQTLNQYQSQSSYNREQNQRHFGVNTVSTAKEEKPMNAKSKKSNSSVQFNCECFEATTQTSQIVVPQPKAKPEICCNDKCDHQCDQCQLEEEASLIIDNTSECFCSSSDSSSPAKTAAAKESRLKFGNIMSKIRTKTTSLQTRNKEIQCSCKCPHCGVNLDDVSKNSTEKKSPNKAQAPNAIPRQPISKRQTTVTKELPKNTNPTNKEESRIKPLNAKAKTAKEEPKRQPVTAKKGTMRKDNNTRDETRNKAFSSREEAKTKADTAKKQLRTKTDNTQIKREESQTKLEPSRKEVKSKTVEAKTDNTLKSNNQEILKSKTQVVPKKELKKTSTEDSTDVSSGSKTANSKRNNEMSSKTSAFQDELDRCKTKLINYCNNQTCPTKNSDPTARLGKAMANIDLDETCNVNQILEILHETVAGLEQQKKLLSQAAAGSVNQRNSEDNSPHGKSPQYCMNFCEQQQQKRRSHRQFPPKNPNFGYLQDNHHCENDEKPVVRLLTDDNFSYPAEPDAPEEPTYSCANHCFWLNRDSHRKRSGSSYPFEDSPKYSPSFTYSQIKRKTLQKCRPTKSFFNLFDMALMMKKNRRCLRQRSKQGWPQKSLIKSREHYEYLVDKNPKYLDMPNRANSYERNILKGLEQQKAICEVFKTKPCRKECQENPRNRKCQMDKEDACRRLRDYKTFEPRKYKVSRLQREQSEQTDLSGKHSNGFRDSSDCRLAFRGERDQKAALEMTDYYSRDRDRVRDDYVHPTVMSYSSEGWLPNSLAQSPVRTDNTKNKSNRGKCYCTGENTNITSEELQPKCRCPKEEKKPKSGKNSYTIYPWKEAETPQDLDLRTWGQYLQTACDNTNCEKSNRKQSSSSDYACYNRISEQRNKKCKNADPKPAEDARNSLSQKSSSLFSCCNLLEKERIEKPKNYEVCQRVEKPTKKKENLKCYEGQETEEKLKGNKEKKQGLTPPEPETSENLEQKQKPTNKWYSGCTEKAEQIKQPEKLENEEKSKQKSSKRFSCCTRNRVENPDRPKKPEAEELEVEPKRKKSLNLFPCCSRTPKEKKEKVKELEPKAVEEEKEPKLEKEPKPKKSLSLFSCCNKTNKEKKAKVKESEPEKVELEMEPKPRKSSNLFSCCHKTHKEKQEPEEPEKEPKQKKSLNLFSCCKKTHKEKKEEVKETEREPKPRQKSPYIFPCFQKSHKEKKEKSKEEEELQIYEGKSKKSTGCFPCVWKPTRDKTETSDYNESECFQSKVYQCVPEAVTVEDCCECDDDEVKILYDSSYKFLKNKDVNDTDCECDDKEKTDLPGECSNNFYSMVQ